MIGDVEWGGGEGYDQVRISVVYALDIFGLYAKVVYYLFVWFCPEQKCIGRLIF